MPSEPRAVPASNSVKPEDQVTAILVTYRSEEVISQAITSLLADQQVTRIFVIDNSCDERCTVALKSKFPTVTVIGNSQNGGFGQGNNIGLELVKTRYALVLNPDVRIQSGGVAELVRLLQACPAAAAIGPWPRTHSGLRKFMRGGSIWSPKRIPYQPEKTERTQFVLGAAMLMEMSALRKAGFFDPEIFLYYEDSELCERIDRAGFEMLVTTHVEMEHHGGDSSSPSPGILEMKSQHYGWSRMYVDQKYRGEKEARRFGRRLSRSHLRRMWMAWLSGRKNKAFELKHQRQGILAFLKGIRPPTNPAAYVTPARKAS